MWGGGKEDEGKGEREVGLIITTTTVTDKEQISVPN